MARTVGERDRARGSEVSRPGGRDLEKVYREREQRKKARAAAGKRPRIEDATTMEEALEAERAAGRAEGARSGGSRRAPGESASAQDSRAPGFEDGPSSGPRPAAPATASPSSPSSSVPGVTAPMVADILIITIDELTQQHRLPIPSRLLVAFGVFGALGLAKGVAARPAKVFAWGIVVATFYSSAPGGKPPALNALAALGDFLGGKFGSTAGAAIPSQGSIAFGGDTQSVGNGQMVS